MSHIRQKGGSKPLIRVKSPHVIKLPSHGKGARRGNIRQKVTKSDMTMEGSDNGAYTQLKSNAYFTVCIEEDDYEDRCQNDFDSEYDGKEITLIELEDGDVWNVTWAELNAKKVDTTLRPSTGLKFYQALWKHRKLMAKFKIGQPVKILMQDDKKKSMKEFHYAAKVHSFDKANIKFKWDFGGRLWICTKAEAVTRLSNGAILIPEDDKNSDDKAKPSNSGKTCKDASPEELNRIGRILAKMKSEEQKKVDITKEFSKALEEAKKEQRDKEDEIDNQARGGDQEWGDPLQFGLQLEKFQMSQSQYDEETVPASCSPTQKYSQWKIQQTATQGLFSDLKRKYSPEKGSIPTRTAETEAGRGRVGDNKTTFSSASWGKTEKYRY